MNRKRLLEEIKKRLGKRNLFWQGIRGADSIALYQIPQFSGIFSITSPLNNGSQVLEVCLENLQQSRVNIRAYDLDQDNSEGARELHRLFFSALKEPAAVLTYKANKFFASVYFPQAGNVEHLGLYCEQQAAFENKIWVESELKKHGVRAVPWSYYGWYNPPDYSRLLKDGSYVLRFGSAKSSHGGANLLIIREQMDIPLDRHDTLYALSPYLEPNIPLNVNACIFPDGTVTLHGPSVQLIGIPSCTGLELAYCGNDFAQIRNLDVNILDELETLVLQVGKWLSSKGYLGVFGVDAIEYEHHVYLNEINPRFQGSSVITAELDRELGRPDMYLNHMAAFFGLPASGSIPLRDLAQQQRETAQIFCYNRSPSAVVHKDARVKSQDNIEFRHLPSPDVDVVPEAMLFKAVVEGRVTTNGRSLLKKYENRISELAKTFSPKSSA